MIMRAILVNVCQVDPSDFAMSGVEYATLLGFEGTVVTVEDEATDDYYDILLSDGTEVSAVSRCHLYFDEDLG